ncbi:hypothetical protein [Aliarcobacter cryaerophilus]|uniref:hypothetical protein n=1 Tax=Aliarcobacter cryaerophilus TaxID=28198 RepID=UPI00112EFE61|nr:hypothetical protein [Aliarcobacter cryaerophilus]
MFFYNINEMIRQRTKQNEAKNYFGNNEKNDLIEMVVSLSEEQTQHYLENGQKHIIDMAFNQFALEVKAKYGFEPLTTSIHYDEGHIKQKDKVKFDVVDSLDMQNKKEKRNYHAQITFFNYDFKNSRSVLRTMKKQDWRDIQDLAQNVFQAFGLDYVRGVSKEITGKEHLNNLEFKIQKLMEELGEMKEENKELKSLNNNLYEDNKDLSFKNDKLNEIIELKNKDIIDKIDNINELSVLFDKTKEDLKDTIKELEEKTKEVAKVKQDLKNVYNDNNNLNNENVKIKSELNNQKQKLDQAIKIEQKLRKMTRQKKEFLAKFEQKVKEVQVLEKDKTLNLSQKIQRMKEIYLKNAPMFGAFNDKNYQKDMMQEFGDLLSVNYVNKTLKQDNIDLKSEVKQLKSLDFVEIERQNKTLKAKIIEKDQKILDQSKDVDHFAAKAKKLDSENTTLKDKIYDLENKDNEKNKNHNHNMR